MTIAMLPVGVLSQIVINEVVEKVKFGLPQALLMIIFIIAGICLTFGGNKYLTPTLIVAGFLSFGFLSRSLLAYFEDDFSDLTYVWTFAVSGLLGIVVSYYVVNLGLTILGGFGGFSLAVFIMPVLPTNNIVIEYLIMAGFVIAGSVLIMFFKKEIVIVSTSLAGTLLFFIGVDQFANTGFDEMIEKLLDGQGGDFIIENDTLMAIAGAFIFIVLLGIYVQWKLSEKPNTPTCQSNNFSDINTMTLV